MFGLLKKADQLWMKKVDGMRAPVADDLNALVTHVASELAVAYGFMEDEANKKVLLDKHGQIVLGFEAFRHGADARKLSDTEPIMKCAAALAQVVCNDVLLKERFDQAKIAGELRLLLGFTRDGSEIRR